MLEVDDARGVGLEGAVVAIVRIGHAARVRGTALLFIRHLVRHGAVTLAPRQPMVPDDEVEALATRNVVRAVPPRAKMYDARAHSMMIRVLVATMVRRADHPTENEPTPLEVAPEAHVERHCEGTTVASMAWRFAPSTRRRTQISRSSKNADSSTVRVIRVDV